MAKICEIEMSSREESNEAERHQPASQQPTRSDKPSLYDRTIS